MSRTNAALLAVIAILGTTAANAAPDGGWSNLYAVTYKREYIFVRQDGPCIQGWIKSVSTGTVRMLYRTQHGTNQIAINRGAIIQIADGNVGAHDAIFRAEAPGPMWRPPGREASLNIFWL